MRRLRKGTAHARPARAAARRFGAGRGARVVVVVGATSGIGRATAVRLARRGDRLALASRSAEELGRVAEDCRAAAPESVPVVTAVVDVLDRDSLDRLFAAATAQHGRVDAVVSTPAVLAYGRFEEIPPEVFDRAVQVNVLGAANVARAALAHLEPGGHLVLFGSLLGTIVAPWMSPYVTSKWAVHGLAHTLRIEARDRGIAVSLVTPGSVDTPVYALAASYAGRVGRPPPPVDRPETVARAVVRVLDHPRRVVSVGLANPVWRTVFRAAPAVYDRVAGPVMDRAGLSRTPTTANEGNVFRPRPGGEAVHGEWGRHWLRWLGGSAVVGAAWGMVRAFRPRTGGRVPDSRPGRQPAA